MNRNTVAIVLAILALALAVTATSNGWGIADADVSDDKYMIIKNADTRKYTDAMLTEDYIYLDSETVMDDAFRDCVTLKKVILSSVPDSIGDRAFQGCGSLDYFCDRMLTSIGEDAFKDSGVREVYLYGDLETIGAGAFENCRNIETLTLGLTGVTALKADTFRNASMGVVDLRNITSIHSTAFADAEVGHQAVTGSSQRLDGVPWIYSEAGTFSRIGTVDGQVYLHAGSFDFLLVTDEDGNRVDTTFHLLSMNGVQYSHTRFTPEPGVNYYVESMAGSIVFPESSGLEPVIISDWSDLPYTLPDHSVGDLSCTGWIIDGAVWDVSEKGRPAVTIDMFTQSGGMYEAQPVYEEATVTLDNSALGTAGDGLPDTWKFTVGDSYPDPGEIPGFVFGGWEVDGEVLPAGSEITTYRDHTATGAWTVIEHHIEYLDADGGVLKRVTVPYGGTHAIDASVVPTEEEGKRHTGWSIGGTPVGTTVTVLSDIRLTPVYEDRRIFTVTFSDGDVVLGTETGYDGRMFFVSLDPVSEGRKLLYWNHPDGSQLEVGDGFVLQEDVVLTPEWSEHPRVGVFYHSMGSVHQGDFIPYFGLTVDHVPEPRDGYTFEGWSLTEGGEPQYSIGSQLKSETEVHLYAVWSEDVRTATFHTADRTVEVEFYPSEGLVIDVDPGSIKEHSFAGWSLSDGGEVEYALGDVIRSDSDIDLYAVWEPIMHTAYFHCQEAVVEKMFMETQGLVLDVDPGNVDGYTFVGWSSSDTGPSEYSRDQTIFPSLDVILYPVWEPIRWTASFHTANGIVEIEFLQIDGLTLDVDPGTKDGFTFSGWSLSDEGAVEFEPEEHIAPDCDVSLYPVWREVERTAYFHDGKDVTEIRFLPSEGLVIETVPVHRDGYTFAGWALSENGHAVYSTGDRVESDGDIHLYASWEAIQHTAYFHLSDGIHSIVFRETEGIVLDVDPGTKEGFDFSGWTLSSDGGPVHGRGETIHPTADVHLYPVWEGRIHTAYFDIDGIIETKSFSEPDGLVLDVVYGTKKGYLFSGWSESTSGSQIYEEGSTIYPEGDVRLYAIWKEVMHTAYFHIDGIIETETFSEPAGLTLDRYPLMDGHTLIGWSLAEGAEAEHCPGDVIWPESDVHLYPVWEEVVLTAYFHTPDGIVEKRFGLSAGLTLDVDYGSLDGHTFAGWSETQDGQVDHLHGSVLKAESDIHLYAVWKELPCTAHFHSGDEVSDVLFLPSEGLKIYIIPDGARGFTFVGWSLSPDGVPAYSIGDIIHPDTDVSLYAVWEEIVLSAFLHNVEDVSEIRFGMAGGLELTECRNPPDGHSFAGWFASEDGEELHYAGEILFPDSDIHLYAIWEENVHTAYFHALDRVEKRSFGEVGGLVLDADPGTRDGYLFAGWSESEEGGSDFSYGQRIFPTADVHLHAVWEEAVHTAYFHTPGGIVERSFTQIEGLVLDVDPGTLSGFEFAGWSASDGGEAEYPSEGTISPRSDIHLYAVWKELIHTAYLHTATETVEREFSEAGGLLLDEDPGSRTGYDFAGWSLTEDGVAEYDYGETVLHDGDIHLYSTWDAVMLTAFFHTTDEVVEVRFPMPDGLRVDVDPGEMSGYSFTGWAMQEGGDAVVEQGDVIRPSSDMHLYPVWERSIGSWDGGHSWPGIAVTPGGGDVTDDSSDSGDGQDDGPSESPEDGSDDTGDDQDDGGHGVEDPSEGDSPKPGQSGDEDGGWIPGMDNGVVLAVIALMLLMLLVLGVALRRR